MIYYCDLVLCHYAVYIEFSIRTGNDFKPDSKFYRWHRGGQTIDSRRTLKKRIEEKKGCRRKRRRCCTTAAAAAAVSRRFFSRDGPFDARQSHSYAAGRRSLRRLVLSHSHTRQSRFPRTLARSSLSYARVVIFCVCVFTSVFRLDLCL